MIESMDWNELEQLGKWTMDRRHFRSVLLGLALMSGLAHAEDPASPKADSTVFLDDARKYVIEVPSERTKLELHEKSLLNWTNPVRQQERGAVYVWLQDGQPMAIGSLFKYEYNEKVYDKHEFQSLTTRPLKSTFDGKLAWTPSAGIEWREFQDSPAPGTTHTARLLQMRQLVRPFRAELTSPKDERTELRLVSRPLFEYSSPKHKIIDGAVFSYAVATDPEILLIVEAIERDAKTGNGFRYAFARFHYWNVAVFDGDRKVWEAPLDKSHEINAIGNRANMQKSYNSYQPRP